MADAPKEQGSLGTLIFHDTALRKMSSADDLDRYLRITNPSAWVLIGAVAVIVVWLVLLWAGMRIARAATDDFGAMISGALTIMLVFQAFLNIGCVIGVFPTTGKPLPFISSGGSSLIASFMMIGLILSVSEDTGGRSVYEGRRDDLRVVRGGRSERARSRG